MQGCLEEYSGLYFQSQGPQHTHACTHGRVRTHLNLCVQDTHTRGFFYRGWGPTTQRHKSHKPSSSLTDGLDQMTSKGPSQAEAPPLSLKFLGSTEEVDAHT